MESFLDDSKNENINFTIEGKVLLSIQQSEHLNHYYKITDKYKLVNIQTKKQL